MGDPMNILEFRAILYQFYKEVSQKLIKIIQAELQNQKNGYRFNSFFIFI